MQAVPGLNTALSSFFDIRGERVLVQALIPGLLCADQQSSLQYGRIESLGIDNWDKVPFLTVIPCCLLGVTPRRRASTHAASQDFHDAIAAAGRLMFIKEGMRTFSDGSQKPWACCVEAKCLKGIGGKKIMMEAFRTTPLDCEWLDDPRRLHLRPELVRHSNFKARSALVDAWIQAQPPLKEGEQRPAPPDFEPVLFNINCFAGADVVASPEEEAMVRGLHTLMIEEQLPQLLERFANGTLAPLDGFGLVDVMHEEGINVRRADPLPRATAIVVKLRSAALR